MTWPASKKYICSGAEERVSREEYYSQTNSPLAEMAQNQSIRPPIRPFKRTFTEPKLLLVFRVAA